MSHLWEEDAGMSPRRRAREIVERAGMDAAIERFIADLRQASVGMQQLVLDAQHLDGTFTKVAEVLETHLLEKRREALSTSEDGAL